MIINQSRIKIFQRCRQLAWFEYEQRLVTPGKAEALITGSAAHEGFASLLSGNSVSRSKELASQSFEKELKDEFLLPEEEEIYEQRKQFVHKAIEKYAKNLPTEGFQVLHPEVKFIVAIPHTEHNCYYFWRAEHPESSIDDWRNSSPSPRYFRPIYYQGKTDAVVVAQGMIWLLEHKTSSDYRQTFWDNFLLDMQVTGYIYGIWKSFGIRPSGAIVNKLQKPNKKQTVEATEVSSEAFLRSDENLRYFEHWITRAAQDYEACMVEGNFYMNTASCFDWNRRCSFHNICLSGNFNNLTRHCSSEQFITRSLDYAEEAYLDILRKEDQCLSTVQ